MLIKDWLVLFPQEKRTFFFKLQEKRIDWYCIDYSTLFLLGYCLNRRKKKHILKDLIRILKDWIQISFIKKSYNFVFLRKGNWQKIVLLNHNSKLHQIDGCGSGSVRWLHSSGCLWFVDRSRTGGQWSCFGVGVAQPGSFEGVSFCVETPPWSITN